MTAQRFPLATLLVASIVLVLPGCMPSGGVSSTSAASTSIKGVVADGYLKGARVFLDKNGNGVLDTADGEPVSDTTSDAGGFEIKGASTDDLAKYQLVAIVPATATDSDIPTTVNLPASSIVTRIFNNILTVIVEADPGTGPSGTTSTTSTAGGVVEKAYFLTYPKGAPADPVISPLSTLVNARMTRLNLSIDEATADVVANLGLQVPASVSADKLKGILTMDMLKLAQVPGSDTYQLAQSINRISRVTMNGIGKALDQAKSTMGITGMSPRDEYELFRLVVDNALDNLSSIAALASALQPENPQTTPPRTKDHVQADVKAMGSALKDPLLGSNLTSQNMIIAQVTQGLAPAAAQKTVMSLLDTGVYGLRGQSSGRYDVAELRAIPIATPPPPPPTEGSPAVSPPTSVKAVSRVTNPYTGGAAATTPVTVLSQDATASWVTLKLPLDLAFLDNESLTLSSSSTTMVSGSAQIRILAATYDIAGKSMDYLLMGNGIVPANGFSPLQRGSGNVTFPAGAEAYRLTFIPQDDVYTLSALQAGGSSVDELLTLYSTLSSNRLTVGNLQLQFAPGATVGATSGSVRFFNAAGAPLTFYKDGLWKRETVRGKEILRLAAVADALKPALGLQSQQELFISRNDSGTMAFGAKTAARTATTSLVFNKTAINAIDDLQQVP